MLTQSQLKEYVEYDPSTGEFFRIKKYGTYNTLGKIETIDGDYYSFLVCGERDTAHRWAFLYMLGRKPLDMVDHINHDKLDNRWENLREVSNQENQRNMRVPKDNTSGVVGVSWNKTANRWIASISVDIGLVHLGSFVQFSDAVNARKNAEVLYGFHTNHGKDL